MTIRYLSKDDMIERLRSVQEKGWIRSVRPLNSGGIGNTIDGLLGLTENNLPIADTAQWELKSHRSGSSSLITLFHMEPEPRTARIVPKVLLPYYGWPDAKRRGEHSFRQTLRATVASDRGFGIELDEAGARVTVSFDASLCADHHRDWLKTVEDRVGLGPLDPQPYWNLQDLELKVSTKMLNSFLVEAKTRRSDGEEYFAISKVLILQGFDVDGFLMAIQEGDVLIDFDARTGHNHGTKVRLRQNRVPALYRHTETVLEGVRDSDTGIRKSPRRLL